MVLTIHTPPGVDASTTLLQYSIWAIAIGLTARVLLFAYRWFASPLRSVPGPFLARFGRLYYFLRVSAGRWEHDDIALHRKYGPVVRVGADLYSIDAPEIIKPVYGVGSKFPKSDWYYGWQHPDPTNFTLFPDRDIKRHAETRKRFQALYSMSSLVSYEGYVDECAHIFETRLTEFARHRETIDLAHWLQCYAFDVIGDITYSQRFGFLDDGRDVAGLLKALHGVHRYSTLAGIYPRWHPLLFSIFGRLGLGGAAGRNYLMKFAQEKIGRRKQERDAAGVGAAAVDKDHDPDAPMDFLEKLMIANRKDPDKVTPYLVFIMGLSNLIAGSDTTGISLSAILYHLVRHPDKMQKLRQEIKDFEMQGRCGRTNVAFSEAREMPYLQAVMKEALRLHPATGLPLWRVVPEGGETIRGYFFPAGTNIGLNSWVAHYNRDVFGPDAAEFRPERWIEAENENAAALKEMDGYYLPFGLGSRTCLGRHISYLEMSKLIPQVVRKFDFELEHPEAEWKTENVWFVKPLDFRVKVRSVG